LIQAAAGTRAGPLFVTSAYDHFPDKTKREQTLARRVRRLDRSVVAISVPVLASLVPVPKKGDLYPQDPDELAVVDDSTQKGRHPLPRARTPIRIGGVDRNAHQRAAEEPRRDREYARADLATSQLK
jgi:hypothetical protein